MPRLRPRRLRSKTLWAKVAVVLAAMPVGVNVYLVGVRYRAGEAETATAILLSSVLSVVTLSAVLVWLEADGG